MMPRVAIREISVRAAKSGHAGHWFTRMGRSSSDGMCRPGIRFIQRSVVRAASLHARSAVVTRHGNRRAARPQQEKLEVPGE